MQQQHHQASDFENADANVFWRKFINAKNRQTDRPTDKLTGRITLSHPTARRGRKVAEGAAGGGYN